MADTEKDSSKMSKKSSKMSKSDDRMEKLFEKMVAGLEALAKSQGELNARVTGIEKMVPPKMDTEKVEGAAEGFNPYEEGEEGDADDNYASPDAFTKPATPAADAPQNFPAHHMAKGKKVPPKPAAKAAVPAKPVRKAEPAVDVKGLIQKSVADAVSEVNKQWETKLPELIKAHTPLPYGMPNTPEANLWMKDPFAFIRKAVEVDRSNCGGDYSTEEGRFGFKTGAGDDNARAETAKFIRKALEG